MRVILLCLVCFSFALPALERPFDQAVSLGRNCEVAFQLQQYGIRKAAYPFDWLITNTDGLCEFIMHRGERFLDRDTIAYLNEFYPHFHVLDCVYGFYIYHDFTTPGYLNDYDIVKARYERRINRFFNLLQSNEKLLFVRTGSSKEEVERLYSVLKIFYPFLNFKILALHNTEEYKKSWGHPGIVNFHREETPGNWHGDTARWEEILNKISFKTSVPTPPVPESEWGQSLNRLTIGQDSDDF